MIYFVGFRITLLKLFCNIYFYFATFIIILQNIGVLFAHLKLICYYLYKLLNYIGVSVKESRG